MHNYPYFTRKTKLYKLGVLVKDLRPSTMSYTLIELGNKIAREHTDIDFYVFHEDWIKPSNSICFPLLQQKNIWYFDGTLISTDIDTTSKLLSMPNICQKFFYIWNMLEYLRLDSAKSTYSIYRHRDLTLLGRSREYSEILQNNFNKPVKVVQDFKYDDILSIIGYRKD